MKLALFLAQMCHYAQEHVGDPDAWDHSDLDHLMQCTSYQVACFLSQNTRDGSSGVDWSVVHKDLCEMPVKSIEEWQKIINDSVEFLGGWQTPIKGIRVIQSMSSMDEDGTDVLKADLTLEQFEKLKELCELQTADYEKYQEEYEEYDCAEVELVQKLLPGKPSQITHTVDLSSYFGSYTSHSFGELEEV